MDHGRTSDFHDHANAALSNPISLWRGRKREGLADALCTTEGSQTGRGKLPASVGVHDTLRTTLAALGFAPSTADPSLFLRTDTSLPLFYILVYVNDLVFATADTAGLAHVKLEHRTKHIALRYFLARELQQRGQLRLAYVASEANTADIFTKALPPGDHQHFYTMLACFALLDWSCPLPLPPQGAAGRDRGGGVAAAAAAEAHPPPPHTLSPPSPSRGGRGGRGAGAELRVRL
ncbi:unnamed protein product [Closterium sp. NIES-53]